MRNLTLSLALAATALATPAFAKEKSWYVEADSGKVIVEKQHVSSSTVGAIGTFGTKTGYDLGGVLGYDFGHYRVETEVSFRRSERKTYFTNSAGYIADQGQLGGGTQALSFMLNGLLDFGSDKGLQGFLGGGAGVGSVKTTISTAVPAVNLADSSTGFAWQGLAGVRAPVSEHLDVGLKYRYFRGENADSFHGATGLDERAKFVSHSLLVTLAYNFGRAAVAAPPPVVTPPVVTPPVSPPTPPTPVTEPTPPPPPVCEKGPFIVYFDWDKSDLNADATAALDKAVQAYGKCQSVPVVLAGYADRSGKPKYNVALSARRNTAVRGYLTAHGIADSVISSQAFGEANVPVSTADGAREKQNRIVEITYGPGSGH